MNRKTVQGFLCLSAVAAAAFVPAAWAGGEPPDIGADLPLWSQQQPLWELGQDQVDTLPLPPADPQPVGTWFGGTALPMHNGELKVSLWGPPERLTFSLGKTDVWDRRYFPEKPLTLEEIRERCFRDDYAQNPLGKYFESLNAYDFPTPKPVGQLILLMPGLEGAEQPTATTRRGDGVATVPLRSGAAGGQVEALTTMTRNVLAVRGEFAGLSGTPQVRVYRHRDTIIPGQSWDHSNGGMRPYPGFDYTRDAPHNGPLDPPASGSDGRYFWITQAMPPEATFPDGFWYVFMATVAGGPGEVETVENRTGLGTDPYMTPERRDGVYPGTTNLWRQVWLDYDRIRESPGAAATALVPDDEWLALATVVTSAEAEDPIAEARRLLEDAERTGWEGLVAENAGWFEAFYRKREDGRVYYAEAERNAGVVNEVAGSWTDAHAGFTRPDPLRWELDRGYNYLNHDWSPWHGSVVLNEPNYTGWHVQNRSDRLNMWWGIVESSLPGARRNAEYTYGCRGAKWGVASVPVRTDGLYYHNLVFEQGMEIPAQLAKLFWDRYDYDGDEAFLRERAWPILLAATEFYEDFLTLGEDGTFHVIPTVPQEYYYLTRNWEKNRNSISALSMIRWHLNTTARAAEILGTARERRVRRWRTIADNLAPYPTADTPEGPVYVKVEGEAADHPTGNLVPQTFPVQHTGEINLDTRDGRREMMERTLARCTGWGFGNTRRLLVIARDLSPEALLNSRSGRLHLFPAATVGVDVGFRRFLARGAFEVSAERVGGEISPLYVTSRLGRDLRLANPWTGREIEAWDLTSGEAVVVEADPAFPDDPLLRTRPGHQYRIAPGRTRGTGTD